MNLQIDLKYTDCCNFEIKIDIICLCSVILVNPSTPASRWLLLLKLQQKKYFYCKAVSQFRETG